MILSCDLNFKFNDHSSSWSYIYSEFVFFLHVLYLQIKIFTCILNLNNYLH